MSIVEIHQVLKKGRIIGHWSRPKFFGKMFELEQIVFGKIMSTGKSDKNAFFSGQLNEYFFRVMSKMKQRNYNKKCFHKKMIEPVQFQWLHRCVLYANTRNILQ